jgi:hypothetical protein
VRRNTLSAAIKIFKFNKTIQITFFLVINVNLIGKFLSIVGKYEIKIFLRASLLCHYLLRLYYAPMFYAV